MTCFRVLEGCTDGSGVHPPRLFLVANRDIAVGDQILRYYGTEYNRSLMEMARKYGLSSCCPAIMCPHNADGSALTGPPGPVCDDF